MKSRTSFSAALGLFALAASLSAQRAYDTPKQAADALIAAAAKADVAALVAILGPDGKKLVDSGDAVRDKQDLTHFAKRAKEKTSIEYDIADPEVAILVVGAEDWPTPIPIVKSGGKWSFDSKSGAREILARRIGGNELDAIAFLRGYVDAQKDYAAVEHDGSGMLQYAQKTLSSPGKQDGLCWKTADGTFAGPMGDEVAAAVAEGYSDKTKPYNGYYFRILTAQGPAARKGARTYIWNGAMIGGFAMIAWPATYDVTGIQTFIVNQDGDVYQKDLGSETAKLAPQIKAYNPDKTWTVTEDALDRDMN
jgi:Protein of unknown function (DUF2950)